MSADKQLAAYVDRVLRMKEEADGIADDIKAIYGEAKAEGYDKTQLGNLVTYLRKRAKDKDGEAEKEAVFDLYLSAYLRAKGEVGTVRATRTHAPDDEITEPQVAPQPAQGSDEAAEPVASRSHSTAARMDVQNPDGRDARPEEVGAIQQEQREPAGTQAPPVEPLSFADRIKKLRPLCQHPNSCRSSGGKSHCYACAKAANEEQGAA